MNIVTKKGDKGKTSLYRGKTVYKDELRVEIFGTIDELNSYLGVSKAYSKRKKDRAEIEAVQKDLFIINSEIATESKGLKELKRRINASDVKKIENLINNLAKKIKLGKDFYLSGQNLYSASLDVARAITRRVERRIVSLSKKKQLKNKNILIYLNRLSDFLFLLARQANKTR